MGHQSQSGIFFFCTGPSEKLPSEIFLLVVSVCLCLSLVFVVVFSTAILPPSDESADLESYFLVPFGLQPASGVISFHNCHLLLLSSVVSLVFPILSSWRDSSSSSPVGFLAPRTYLSSLLEWPCKLPPFSFAEGVVMYVSDLGEVASKTLSPYPRLLLFSLKE